MSTVCSTKTSKGVGTSTNCSTSCGSRTRVRTGMPSRMILGTSITCSATGKSASKKRMMSCSWSTISGTGASSVCRPGTVSTICSTVCRWTRTCGPNKEACQAATRRALRRTTTRRAPAGGVWGDPGASPCRSSRTPPPALAMFCKAMATVILAHGSVALFAASRHPSRVHLHQPPT